MTDETLGILAMQILRIMEEHQECDVGTIRRLLEAQGHTVAYTTVMTVMSRLFEKGKLSRRKEGRKFIYLYTKHSENSKKGFLATIKNRLFGNAHLAAVVSFLDEENISKEDLKKLKEIVEQKIKARGEEK